MNLQNMLVSFENVDSPSFDISQSFEPKLNNLDRLYDFRNLLNQQSNQKTNQNKEEFDWNMGLKGSDNTMQNIFDNAFAQATSHYKSKSNNQTEQRFRNQLKKYGLKDYQIDGIANNIKEESGFNLDAVSKDGYNSYGLAQWTGKRKDNLFKFAGTKNPTVEQQADFLMHELNTSERGALAALRNSKNGYDATIAMLTKFERPAAQYVKSRTEKAKRQYGIG